MYLLELYFPLQYLPLRYQNKHVQPFVSYLLLKNSPRYFKSLFEKYRDFISDSKVVCKKSGISQESITVNLHYLFISEQFHFKQWCLKFSLSREIERETIIYHHRATRAPLTLSSRISSNTSFLY